MNNANWRVYVAEKMFNWVEPIEMDNELEGGVSSYDDHFSVAIKHIWLKQKSCVVCGFETSI